MKLVIEIPNSLYANLKTIKHNSIASSRILECVKNGTPLQKGHWTSQNWHCSLCSYTASDRRLKFCPKCGAIMKGE